MKKNIMLISVLLIFNCTSITEPVREPNTKLELETIRVEYSAGNFYVETKGVAEIEAWKFEIIRVVVDFTLLYSTKCSSYLEEFSIEETSRHPISKNATCGGVESEYSKVTIANESHKFRRTQLGSYCVQVKYYYNYKLCDGRIVEDFVILNSNIIYVGC